MGNCQTAAVVEAAVIHHPGGSKVERIYCLVTASEIMNSNPGHYLAHVVEAPAADGDGQVKQLMLLRPDDSLVIGQVYRLISFEDVLKVFSAKKSTRLGKLLKESGAKETKKNRVVDPGPGPSSCSATSVKMEMQQELHQMANIGIGDRRRPMQWRPALESISELNAN